MVLLFLSLLLIPSSSSSSSSSKTPSCPNPFQFGIALSHAAALRHPAGLDNLSAPGGPIKRAQELAARASGADHTFFLVNGSTVGIHAAVLATCKPGDALIMARNCHLCAFSAAVLAGAYPIYALPEFDSQLGIAHGVSPQLLRREFDRAARKGLNVGAVLVVSPTYYGITSDIKGAVPLFFFSVCARCFFFFFFFLLWRNPHECGRTCA